MTRYLVVCLGNICRSPMGEGWLRHLAMVQGGRAKVDSAGTSAHHVGEGPDRRSISAMRAVDIDISGQRSRQFERNDFKNFDRILVMDQANLRDVLSMAKTEEQRAKVALFDPTGASVPDPYYGGADGFTEVREQVRRAAEAQLALTLQ
ncbi:low molecular weight phosphotyrosine protein phosphatase [Flavobacteriales bacterium]|nr:low molecular weight phosphotyrosine protein phosphatase [Flavobacteriales bacterium]